MMSDRSEATLVPVATEPVPFWRSVGQALRGEHHDYTAERLPRAVLLLAVPMVLEMVMESLFAIADVFWVSRLGKDAVAVIGITESLMTLIYAVAIGISIAATAIVSRRIGEKDPERAAHAAGQIVLLGVCVSAGLGLLLGGFAPQILRAMGTEEAIVTLGADFARVMLGGNATVFLIFLINAVFRGAGDAVIAMRTLWLANALNIALGPCFIFGWGPFPEMGVTGAAVATNIGRGVGVLYQLWHLADHHSRVRLRWRHLRPEGETLGGILRTSGSGISQLLISTTSWVGLFKLLAVFGSTAVAGYTIAIRIVVFALLPAVGLANAGATLVGQNLGAKKPERAEAAVWIATRINTLFLGGVGLLFIIFADPLTRIFAPEPGVLRFATRALWIVSLALPLYAAGMCLEGAFNGAGDTWTPARLNFACLWVFQIPFAWLLAHSFQLGPLGIFISVPAAYTLLTLWSAVLFRRGRWKLKHV
ncbi:MAG TPA: MATE family efflux transporter [Chthoniobacteraceae bacterium]|nr:MATE family efflux transporter [Chthoniobacteraceae bacterium]